MYFTPTIFYIKKIWWHWGIYHRSSCRGKCRGWWRWFWIRRWKQCCSWRVCWVFWRSCVRLYPPLLIYHLFITVAIIVVIVAVVVILVFDGAIFVDELLSMIVLVVIGGRLVDYGSVPVIQDFLWMCTYHIVEYITIANTSNGGGMKYITLYRIGRYHQRWKHI